ncbi:MAG: hypothetical protein L0219_12325, partial [Phycisphaerales bacterium]|nr:hypothetical protein [Phycisphaerales bacterium]
MRSRLTHLIALLALLAMAAAILTPVFNSTRLISVQANPAPADEAPACDDLGLGQLALLLDANVFDSESADSAQNGAAAAAPSKPERRGDMRPRRRPAEPVNPAEWPDERQFRDSRVKLTPEVLDRCVEVAHDVDPAFGQQLASKRERSPQQFESVLRNHAWRVLALA